MKSLISLIGKKFTINGNIKKVVVKDYFNKTTSLMFDDNAAFIEQECVKELINKIEDKNILDLGCGDGRYSKVIGDFNTYHGVDFSESFISMCPKNEKAKFTCHDVSTFIEDTKYNIILIIGLITYLEDEDILQLIDNVKKMASKDCTIILRSVTLKEEGQKKIYYDSKKGLLNRIRFLKPRYQIIRRTLDYELNLFKDFKLINHQVIEGTSYTLYSFKL